MYTKKNRLLVVQNVQVLLLLLSLALRGRREIVVRGATVTQLHSVSF